MTIKKIVLLLSLTLSACSTIESFTMKEQNSTQVDNNEAAEESTLNASLKFNNQYTQQFKTQKDSDTETHNQNAIANQTEVLPKQNINFYVRGLMQDLVANLQYVNSTTPVAVVSFVMLDSDYNQANVLGNQIAESLMHEIHKFGIPVIDFKTTDYIMVTPQGDFAFTRDYEEVNPTMPARYIVGGTMVKQQGGYLINARIVGIQSKAVVASAQSFIPYSVSDPILAMSTVTNYSLSNEAVDLGSVSLQIDNNAKNAPPNRVALIQD